MKKFFTLMGAMLLVALLGLCAGCKDSPKKVVEKWQAAILKGDGTEATKYVSGTNATIETGILAAAAKDTDAQKEKVFITFKNSRPGNEKINGDSATVEFGSDTLELKKIDGKWKIVEQE